MTDRGRTTYMIKGEGGKAVSEDRTLRPTLDSMRPPATAFAAAGGKKDSDPPSLEESTAEEAPGRRTLKSMPPSSQTIEAEIAEIWRVVGVVSERIPLEFPELSEKDRKNLAKELLAAAKTAIKSYTKSPLQEFSFLVPPNSKLSELVFKEFKVAETEQADGRGAAAQAEV